MTFATTHWSLVLAAGRGTGQGAQDALTVLCESYWYPVYAYMRRARADVHDVEDLVQGFFCELIEKRELERADPERGRFRAFLLTAARHYGARQHAGENTLKRGGGEPRVSIDAAGAETRLAMEPVDHRSPEQDFERAFDRDWARTQLERAIALLRGEYESGGRANLFDALRPRLTGTPDTQLAEIATELEMETGAVKVALHRLRKRLGRALRAEVAETVEQPGQVDDELAYLFEALS